EPSQLRLAGEKAEQRCERGPDLVGPLLVLLNRCGDLLADLLRDEVVGGEEAVLLGLEVLIERAPRDRRGLGDVVAGRLRDAVVRDGDGETCNQALPVVGRDELARETMAAGREARELRRPLGLGDLVGGLRSFGGHYWTIPSGLVGSNHPGSPAIPVPYR